MEKNDFLLINEIIYHIHTCESLEELQLTILSQTKFIIPFSYASLITVEIDPDTKEILHSNPICLPESFASLEEAWIQQSSQDPSLWLSHAPESMVIRESEILGEENRLASPIYQKIYQRYNIFDILQMNVAYHHQVMALLSFYRTRVDGAFTDQEAFFLRSLRNHINYAYYKMSQRAAAGQTTARSMEEIARDFGLTKREEEILSLVFQDLNNEEILEKLTISKHTLLKHLQNLYRKCDVSSRWDLLKLRM